MEERSEERGERVGRGWAFVVARATAAFLAGLILLHAIGTARGGLDRSLVWIDLRPLGGPWRAMILAVTAVLAGAFAWRPTRGGLRRVATVGCFAVLAMWCVRDGMGVRSLEQSGAIEGSGWPLSWSFAAVLAALAWSAARPSAVRLQPLVAAPLFAGSLFLLALGFPLAQMHGLGGTSYARSADAVVVLGARTYADGRPSLALADRLRTGTRLVLDGTAEELWLSGGPGDGQVHETEAMRRFAIEAGVDPERIHVDPLGWSTKDTARGLAPELRGARVLAVSHDYHLPRVRLAFAREGLEVWTVPAEVTRPLARRPYYMLREVAAYWAYAVLGWG